MQHMYRAKIEYLKMDDQTVRGDEIAEAIERNNAAYDKSIILEDWKTNVEEKVRPK